MLVAQDSINTTTSCSLREVDYVSNFQLIESPLIHYYTIESFICMIIFLASFSMLEKWAKGEILLQTRLSELQSRFAVLEQMFHRTLASIGETAKAAGVFLSTPRGELDECYQLALELFAGLQKRSKEQRELEDNSVAMAKTVVRALKFRNQLFTDCFTQIRLARFLFFSLVIILFN